MTVSESSCRSTVAGRVRSRHGVWRSRQSTPRDVARCGWTTARYREIFGWVVENRGGRAALRLGHGMVAVAVPPERAPGIATHLHRAEADAPAVAVAGSRPYWFFLADANDSVVTTDELPSGIRVLTCVAAIPVPAEDIPCDGVRWVVPPDPSRRWLPTAAAVLCAARTSSPEYAGGTTPGAK